MNGRPPRPPDRLRPGDWVVWGDGLQGEVVRIAGSFAEIAHARLWGYVRFDLLSLAPPPGDAGDPDQPSVAAA